MFKIIISFKVRESKNIGKAPGITGFSLILGTSVFVLW